MIAATCLAISIFTTTDHKTLVEINNTTTHHTTTVVYENDLDAGAHIKELEELVLELNKECGV